MEEIIEFADANAKSKRKKAKVIFEGPCAYSSLDYDRNTGHFYLLYEKGTEQDDANPYAEGLNIAEFDLEWLMQEI